VRHWIRVGLAGLAAAAIAGASSGAALGALPDGRVYEQVSPPNKNGNVVNNPFDEQELTGSFGLAAESGNSVVFVGTGAMGNAFDGLIGEFVARRSATGWSTSSAVPRLLEPLNIIATEGPNVVVPSLDFSSFLFGSFGLYVSTEPFHESSSSNIFLSRDPAVEPTWIAQPTIADPVPLPGHNNQIHDYLIAGATPDLSTVYFTYSGTLIPEDTSRAPYVGNGQNEGGDPWGFYEWSAGQLRAAGTLPDGSLSPRGAVPAAIAADSPTERGSADGQAQVLDNQVSADGERAFFVSPDPILASPAEPPELYMRETLPTGGDRSVLVSRSELPSHAGEPAATGPGRMASTPSSGGSAASTYVFASTDGSRAFFQSTDALTESAKQAEAAKETPEGAPKLYEFDVGRDTVTYLPHVSGSIAAVAPNGSSFIFENRSSSPWKLELWRSGAAGGKTSQIRELPNPPDVGAPFQGAIDISGARASADGSTYAFRTNSPLPGPFNNAGGFAQVYRYSLASGSLDCVSCPPQGVAPTGDAHVSYDNAAEGRSNGFGSEPMSTLDTRVISADGSRVFFDTPDPLVNQDTNGVRDVYEWEGEHQYLISSGRSAENSYVLDSSASGDDVFFTTDFGLSSGDVDNAYDVYDARVPRPGDSPPSGPAECGDCRGSVADAPAPATPASATFEGSGNLAQPPAPSKPPLSTAAKRARQLKAALLACSHRPRNRRRHCRMLAKRRFGSKAAHAHARPRS
jgi:hypothetical protein